MPGAAADVSKIRELGNLPKETVLADSRISCWFPLATRQLTSMVGASNMADETPEIKEALSEALNFLVLSYGTAVSWNMSVTAQGIVINKSQGGEGGSIALAGKDLLEYYSQQYRARAEELAQPYLEPSAGSNTPPLGISRADYCHEET